MGIYYWCGEVRIRPEAATEVESLIAHHGLTGCVRVWRGQGEAAVIVSGDNYGWTTLERIDHLLHDIAARGLLSQEVAFIPYQFDTSRGYTVLWRGRGLVASVDTGALIVDVPNLPPGEHQIPVRVLVGPDGRGILLPGEA